MLPIKNPTKDEIETIIGKSEHKAAKWLKDALTGDTYYWPAEIYQHAVVAAAMKVKTYDKGIATLD